MKTIRSITALLPLLMIGFTACDKDNLDGPDARFYGEIRDVATGELVEQELVNGSTIKYIEEGFANPSVQSLIMKDDGTFRNNLMFSGTYRLILNNSNFLPQDTIKDYRIKKGDNFQVFEVTPYLRILEPSITRQGNKIVARFRLEQTTDDPVAYCSLFGHTDAHVSYQMNSGRATIDLGRTLAPGGEEFTIELDLNSMESPLPNRTCYFRIGAATTAGSQKPNYATAVGIEL